MKVSPDRLTWIAIAAALGVLVLTRHNHVSHEGWLYPSNDMEADRPALPAHAQLPGAEYARSQRQLPNHDE
jgi:hypothetical protein